MREVLEIFVLSWKARRERNRLAAERDRLPAKGPPENSHFNAKVYYANLQRQAAALKFDFQKLHFAALAASTDEEPKKRAAQADLPRGNSALRTATLAGFSSHKKRQLSAGDGESDDDDSISWDPYEVNTALLTALAETGVAFPPMWNRPPGVAPAVVPPHATMDGVAMNMRLVDYYIDESGNPVYADKWEQLRSWVQSLGFTFVLSHGTSQHGLSCGSVAARVMTWLRCGRPGDQNRNFMTIETRPAAALSYVRAANMKLSKRNSEVHPCRSKPGTTQTTMLFADEVLYLAYWWNHLYEDEATHIGNVQGAHMPTVTSPGFDYWWDHQEHLGIDSRYVAVPYDQFASNLAVDVAAVRDGKKQHVRRYGIFNTHDSTARGAHWVTVVYDIEKTSQDLQDAARIGVPVGAPPLHGLLPQPHGHAVAGAASSSSADFPQPHGPAVPGGASSSSAVASTGAIDQSYLDAMACVYLAVLGSMSARVLGSAK